MEPKLPPEIQKALLEATNADAYQLGETIQTLWSGYGKIERVKLSGASHPSVILKLVDPPNDLNHPRGWNSNRSHQRKLRSYEVETCWYQNWSQRCDNRCRVPKLLLAVRHQSQILLALEDLDQAGFPLRRQQASPKQIESCLRWLAEFHATFLGQQPEGLWPTGTYWHLETRPDELAVLDDAELQNAAPVINSQLANARFQTLVHGDAKLANFCFAETADQGDDQGVAAVDFQYVGGGCGIKDVAYFLGSCLYEEELERKAATFLESYFGDLSQALKRRQPNVDAAAVAHEWSELFPWAWTDFHRFLKGWSPGHWKINSFSERIAREVIGKTKIL